MIDGTLATDLGGAIAASWKGSRFVNRLESHLNASSAALTAYAQDGVAHVDAVRSAGTWRCAGSADGYGIILASIWRTWYVTAGEIDRLSYGCSKRLNRDRSSPSGEYGSFGKTT